MKIIQQGKFDSLNCNETKIFSITEIVKLAKGENETHLSKLTQCEQDTYEMQVRAANIGKLYKMFQHLQLQP